VLKYSVYKLIFETIDIAPYNKSKPTFDSTIKCYWVLPSFENEVHSYGRPMNMNFTTKPEKQLTSDIVMALVSFFKVIFFICLTNTLLLVH